jgi:GAF domain-containing protein
MEGAALLERALVEVTSAIVDEFDVVELLTQLTERCVEILGISEAGIMLVGAASDLEAMASSSESMNVIQLLESQAHEGPCLDCYRSGTAVVVEDLTNSRDRWGTFGFESLAAGIQSVYVLPMRRRGTTIGVLCLFSSTKRSVSLSDISSAQVFADVATIAILLHHSFLDTQSVDAQLHHALDSRVVIEQARGMLTEEVGVSVETTFAMIRSYAREHRLSIVEVARNLTNGELATNLLGSRTGGSEPA